MGPWYVCAFPWASVRKGKAAIPFPKTKNTPARLGWCAAVTIPVGVADHAAGTRRQRSAPRASSAPIPGLTPSVCPRARAGGAPQVSSASRSRLRSRSVPRCMVPTARSLPASKAANAGRSRGHRIPVRCGWSVSSSAERASPLAAKGRSVTHGNAGLPVTRRAPPSAPKAFGVDSRGRTRPSRVIQIGRRPWSA